MTEPSTYEIVLRGHLSARLLARLRDDFSIDNDAGHQTRLIGEIRDPAHLHGVVTQLTSLAVDIVSLAPVPPGLAQPTNPSERES